MKTLVLSEKPSVGQSIGTVLNAWKKHDGYIEGEQYVVSWCFGHLTELADASAYNPDYAKWALRDLPIIPDTFQHIVQPDKRKQYDVLRELLNREDISEVVNACDAGREGELIFRTVYTLSGCTKPMKRLWISSMEENAIREGFQNLKPGSDYDGLYQSALCRAKADWLVGINATRFFSLIYDKTLNVGRVLSPTLALLVQREAEIAAFVPEPFYTVQLDCGFPASTERITDKEEAQRIVAACQKHAVVLSVEQKERTERPPALYDLTTLQRDANRMLNYTAQQTLDYLQSLYEKKLCTYPRTDSRFLTNDMSAVLPANVAAAAAVCGEEVPAAINAGQVCDSTKVSDHHAVIPTASAGKANMEALPLGEREILKLVSRSLLRALSAPFRYAETTVMLECGGHIFTAKGKSVLGQGWKLYEKQEAEKAIPPLSEGQSIPVMIATVKEGKTTPAKRFTDDTLLAGMESAGGADMPDEAERKGIGTPATRAGILEKLVTSGLAQRKTARKASSLIPTNIGTALITILPEELQSPQLTAEWEQKLKRIEHGELEPDEFISGIADMLRNLVKTYQPVPGSETLFPSNREAVGKCPRCGGKVTESPKGFFCEKRTCSFALWKNSKFFSAKKKQLTKSVASALLNEGRVKLTGCWSEKTGKSYDATVILEDDGERTSYKLAFDGG